MPSYFFNARGPGRYVTDSEGVELDGIHDAHALALQTTLDIASDPVGFQGAGSWAVEVMDADGQIVMIIPFSHSPAFEPRGSAGGAGRYEWVLSGLGRLRLVHGRAWRERGCAISQRAVRLRSTSEYIWREFRRSVSM